MTLISRGSASGDTASPAAPRSFDFGIWPTEAKARRAAPRASSRPSAGPARFAASPAVFGGDPILAGRLRAGVETRLAALAPEARAQVLRQAFGAKADRLDLSRVPTPRVIVVPQDMLGRAHGAYSAADGGTIYLSAATAADPGMRAEVFAEEFGHHLDAHLGADAAGDEGAVFRLGLDAGGPLAADELSLLRSENDRGTITIDGQRVSVEFWGFGGGSSSSDSSGGYGGSGHSYGGSVSPSSSPSPASSSSSSYGGSGHSYGGSVSPSSSSGSGGRSTSSSSSSPSSSSSYGGPGHSYGGSVPSGGSSRSSSGSSTTAGSGRSSGGSGHSDTGSTQSSSSSSSSSYGRPGHSYGGSVPPSGGTSSRVTDRRSDDGDSDRSYGGPGHGYGGSTSGRPPARGGEDADGSSHDPSRTDTYGGDGHGYGGSRPPDTPAEGTGTTQAPDPYAAGDAWHASTHAPAFDATAGEVSQNASIRHPPDPINVENGLGPVTVDGVTYEVGMPHRPDIRHDNGFLQNPADPADPVPQPTRAPTPDESAFHRTEVIKAKGGRIVSKIPGTGYIDERFTLDHALPAYDHFLTGEGADQTFDYDAYVIHDPSGQALKADVEGDVRRAADKLYEDLDTRVPDTQGSSVAFETGSGAMPIGSGFDPTRAYPETENWQKAIGGHTAWSESEITVTRQPEGSLVGTAKIELRAEDRYNFNPSQADIATGTPDEVRGVLEESGLAQQYTQTGTAKFETSWVIGLPGTPTSPAGGQIEDR